MASRARGAARRGPASSPVSALLHKLGPDKSALDCAKVFADAIGNGNLGQGAARAAVPTLAELHATAVPFIAGSGPEPEHKPPSKALIYRRAILVGKLSTKEGCMQVIQPSRRTRVSNPNPNPNPDLYNLTRNDHSADRPDGHSGMFLGESGSFVRRPHSRLSTLVMSYRPDSTKGYPATRRG